MRRCDPSLSRHLRVTAYLLLFFVLTGCLRPPGLGVKTFTTQEAAGSVHVSIESSASFDSDYIDQMQLNFELTNDQALSLAIAQAQVRDLLQFRALLIEAGARLPVSTVEDLKTTTLDAAGATTVTRTTTEREAANSLENLPSAPTAVSPAITPFTPSTLPIQTDAVFLYKAAASLKKEVILLSRSLRDAAVARGTKPFVVRFIVTLNPAARREPYNAFATISLFSDGPEKELPPILERSGADLRGVREQVRNLLGAGHASCGSAIEAVPLFVTDNVESSSDTLALESTLNAGGAVNGVVQNIAALIGVRRQQTDRERTQGRSFNALFTLARIAGNTVDARLGAFMSGGEVEMVPRTYNVTVLALVPTVRGALERRGDDDWMTLDPVFRPLLDDILPCRQVAFSATSRFVHAKTGATLPSRFAAQSTIAMEQLAATWGITDTTQRAHLPALLRAVQFDDFDTFKQRLTTAKIDAAGTFAGDAAATRMFWQDVVSIARSSGRNYGRFTLPNPPFEFFTDAANGTVLDDGETARLRLVGSKNLSGTGLSAALETDGPGCHVFYSTTVTVAKDGRSAAFEFPSPKKMLGQAPAIVRVTVTRGGGSKSFEPQFEYQWRGATDQAAPGMPRLSYLVVPKATDPPSPVTMDVTAAHVVITDVAQAAGTFAVAFRSADPTKPQQVRLTVSGGHITATEPASEVRDLDRLVTGHGTYLVHVANLAERQKLVVRAFRVDEKGNRDKAIGEPATLDVVAGERPPGRDGTNR